MSALLQSFEPYWMLLPELLRYLIVTVLKIVVVLVPLIIAVAYFTYWERKIIGRPSDSPAAGLQRLDDEPQ